MSRVAEGTVFRYSLHRLGTGEGLRVFLNDKSGKVPWQACCCPFTALLKEMLEPSKRFCVVERSLNNGLLLRVPPNGT